MTPETRIPVDRALTPEQATSLVGTQVGTDLTPTIDPPADGTHIRLVDAATDQTVALITRLTPELRRELRRALLGVKFQADGVARIGRNMTGKGATFGYAPRKVMAGQEGCRMTVLGRDQPDIEHTLENVATLCGQQYRNLHPDQAKADDELLSGRMLDEWRIGESTYWTSGVINQTSVLPYHRDGNNFRTWSAMPTLRYGMTGGHLHLPEYDTVFPTSDGDITWFYGRGLVHGVTNMRRRKPDGYRYSVVFYALQGMANCATYAEETAQVAARRTERERAEADRIRAERGLSPEQG